ncbi:geranylgeranyl reductase family protein [Euhalothece natronophila Z-M001]|uniref:Geranylgeranyl reductase family protein n=1 Tax=Euhalothece natronophila Z-M001 TaxID=522448 RepID=A0A5B8NK00_9CHRO|nr:geranylgeranyl reductase family protein [Euhalothece natronophila]QDZ39374.1 geranylgeranyl reductase family protein [Euhalothece natronophila Z-M001]
MSKLYDCIIVGSGPAGASAAYHLAKRGRSVLILEKETLPRYKPCGGGVAPIIQDWFDFDFSPAISLKVSLNHYTWNKGDPFEAELNLKEPIWMVRRDVFDYFIVQQSQKQGAQLQENTLVKGVELETDKIIIKTDQGDYTGQYLIAADGGRGPLANWLGFKKRKRILAGALETEVPINHQISPKVYFEFGLVKSGYLWNFPKADGYSIGIGAFHDRGSQNLKEILADYAQLFAVDLSEVKHYGHPISLWNGNQKLHSDRAILAGEAACVVDPFTAEGIRPSIFSGIKAAEAMDKALEGDSKALENYSRTIAEEWGKEMIWAQRLGKLFYRFPAWGYQVGVKRESATNILAKVLTGELRYSQVAQRGIKRLAGVK